MKDLEAQIVDRFQSSIEVKQQTLSALMPSIIEAAKLLVSAYGRGNKAIFIGNGGSAADAQHLAAEFLGRYLLERRPLPALALTTNTSTITAIGNDYGYEQVFSRPLEAMGVPGDVVVGISTSGNSECVIAAMKLAGERQMATIALTGRTGGQMKNFADVLLNVPSTETPRIQETHILIGHVLCEIVEAATV